MISVVIPLYNKQDTIQRALRSVLRQSLPPDEVIVVDDGSTDDSLSRLQEMTSGHSNIKVFSQSNQGVSSARNRGITEARGEMVAFLDADDEWHLSFLATLHALSEKYPQCGVFAAGYEQVDKHGIHHPVSISRVSFEGKEGILDNYFCVAAHSHPPINSSSIIMRTNAIKAIGGFPIGIGQGEDLLTWARLAVGYQIAYCRSVLSYFYTGTEGEMDIPKRIPKAEDVVGRELANLHDKHPDIPGFKDYIAHWHKMRASIYLRLNGYGNKCRKEIALARMWNPHSKRLALYSLLLTLPYPLRMNLLHKIK